MLEEGYFQDKTATCARLAPKLSSAVAICKALAIPPAFIFLFDEAWECFYALDPMIRFFLGDTYKVLPDFWTWHVDPQGRRSRLASAPRQGPWRPGRQQVPHLANRVDSADRGHPAERLHVHSAGQP